MKYPSPNTQSVFARVRGLGKCVLGRDSLFYLPCLNQSASSKRLPWLHKVLGCCDPLLKSSPRQDWKHHGPVLWFHQSCDTLTLKKTHFPLPGPSQPGRRGQMEPVFLQGRLIAPPSTLGVSPRRLSALTSLHACSVSLTKCSLFTLCKDCFNFFALKPPIASPFPSLP